MFSSITLHGAGATVLWGWNEAAVLTSWRIRKHPDGHWSLSGTVSRSVAIYCRQKALLFTAPREHKGFWAWPIEGDLHIVNGQLGATLGPPEQ